MKYQLNEPALQRTLAKFPGIDADFVCDAVFQCIDDQQGPATRDQETVWLVYQEACLAIPEDQHEDPDSWPWRSHK